MKTHIDKNWNKQSKRDKFKKNAQPQYYSIASIKDRYFHIVIT